MGLLQPLRLGTVELFRALRQHGHQVWIYTTSFRTPLALVFFFGATGADQGGDQSGHAHQTHGGDWRRIQGLPKYPPAFGIDVLVDDWEGVLMEGRKRNFQVIPVTPDDCEWTAKVLEGLAIEPSADGQHRPALALSGQPFTPLPSLAS